MAAEYPLNSDRSMNVEGAIGNFLIGKKPRFATTTALPPVVQAEASPRFTEGS